MNEEYQFVFLTYLNRSGSTLIGSHLNYLEDVVVGLETKINDGIYKGRRISLENEKELKIFIEKLYQDEKFKSWGINKNDLREKIAKLWAYPITIRDILITAFLIFRNSKDEKIFIHKNGHFLSNYNRVFKEFPNSKILFINRDPRAIFNSQKKSIDSVSNKPMEPRIVKFLLNYIYIHRKLNELKDNESVLIVRYEDFINYKSKILKTIGKFIGTNGKQKKDLGEYSSLIPDSQKHLHKKVGYTLDEKRIYAWKSELNIVEIKLIQEVLKKDIRKYGYNIQDNIILTITEKIFFLTHITLFKIISFIKIYELKILLNRYF